MTTSRGFRAASTQAGVRTRQKCVRVRTIPLSMRHNFRFARANPNPQQRRMDSNSQTLLAWLRRATKHREKKVTVESGQVVPFIEKLNGGLKSIIDHLSLGVINLSCMPAQRTLSSGKVLGDVFSILTSVFAGYLRNHSWNTWKTICYNYGASSLSSQTSLPTTGP